MALSSHLQNCIESQEGGTSRFGALATGLAALSEDYEVRTPPYIILLCRTFLTLEGMAGTADPTFNIYKASLPYAIRRAMSPSTKQGVQVSHPQSLHVQGSWLRLQRLFGMPARRVGDGMSFIISGLKDHGICSVAK